MKRSLAQDMACVPLPRCEWCKDLAGPRDYLCGKHRGDLDADYRARSAIARMLKTVNGVTQ